MAENGKDGGWGKNLSRLFKKSSDLRPTMEEQLKQSGRPTAVPRGSQESIWVKLGLKKYSQPQTMEEQLRAKGMPTADLRRTSQEEADSLAAKAYRDQQFEKKYPNFPLLPTLDFPESQPLQEAYQRAFIKGSIIEAKKIVELAEQKRQQFYDSQKSK